MSSELKDLLLGMANEIEELRANLAVVSQFVSPFPTSTEAREAKNLALQGNRATFDKLRKQIEGLA